MARHKEPDFVVQWRNQPTPRVCHTCDWYGKDGICQFYKEEPTEDFASSHGKCEAWIVEIPF